MAEQVAGDVTPKKSRKGLIVAITAVVLLGGGTGAWVTLVGKDGDTEKKAEVEQKLPPQFVELDPPFVVNFRPGSSARFLQVAVQLMTRDPAMVHQLEYLAPILRNDLLMLYGDKQVEEVSTPEGKEALRAATLEAVRKVVKAENGDPNAVEAVYFTSFVMQ
jgi:flagellar FliL protein